MQNTKAKFIYNILDDTQTIAGCGFQGEFEKSTRSCLIDAYLPHPKDKADKTKRYPFSIDPVQVSDSTGS